MKTKNIYKMGMAFSAFFGVFPLLGLVVANILAKYFDCGAVSDASIPDCPMGETIYTLFVFTWFTIITLPIGIFLFLMFLLLYISVRRR